MAAHPRFLGWREQGSPGNASLSHLPVGAPESNIHVKLEEKEPSIRKAIWSDDASLERTDGFNLKSWKDEFRSALPARAEPLKVSKVAMDHPRAIKLIGHVSRGPSPAPAPSAWGNRSRLSVPAPSAEAIDFSSATCPEGLVKALEALALQGGLEDAAQGGHAMPEAMDRALWIKERNRRSKLPAKSAELAFLEFLPPVTPKVGQARAASANLEPLDEIEEDMCIALADLPESELGYMCRGNLPTSMKERERQHSEQARWRHKTTQEVKQRNREAAKAWRSNVMLATHVSQETESMTESAEHNLTEDDKKATRMRKVIERINTRDNGSLPVPSPRGHLGVDTTSDSFAPLATEQRSDRVPVTSSKDAPNMPELSQGVAYIKKRVRTFILANIKHRQKHVDKMMAKRKNRATVFSALPDVERAAIEYTFKRHCCEQGVLTIEGALRGLRDLGLRGCNMLERLSIEHVVTCAFNTLISVEELGVQNRFGASPAGQPQIWWTSQTQVHAPDPTPAEAGAKPRPPKLRISSSIKSVGPVSSRTPRKQAKTDRPEQKATLHPMGIPLEAFGAEIAPAARWELYEQRTELHSRAFLKQAEKAKGNSNLTPEQFSRLVDDLNLSSVQGPLPPSVDSDKIADQGRSSKKDSPRASRAEALDFETVHVKLIQLEEKQSRDVSAREWQVSQIAKLNEKQFFEFRSELVWLWDLFVESDHDRSGLLGYHEVRRVLKYLGLEPWTPRMQPVVDKLLRDIDADENQEIDFGEFLALLQHCRESVTSRRRASLTALFDKLDQVHHGLLHLDHVVPALAQSGLLKSRTECAMAQALIDQEFDVSSILHSQDTSAEGQTINDFDELTVDFEGFSNIYQRVFERLSVISGRQVAQTAEQLHFTMHELSDVQAAFDTFDTDHSGALEMEELRNVLEVLLERPPDEDQLRRIVEEVDRDGDGTVDVTDFLYLLRKLASRGSSLSTMVKPFTIRANVPYAKQQEALSVYPISDHYIKSLDPTSLMEMLCEFLNVTPDQNLKDLPSSVGNFRQLKELAVISAEKAQRRL